jgi:hypothetical protein
LTFHLPLADCYSVRNSNRTIKALLFLSALLLSALALLAGCKLFPQQDAFLRSDDKGVMFIRWTREGARITGTIDISVMEPDNDIVTDLITFDGQSDGQTVTMNWKSSWTAKSIEVKGALKGNTMMLFMADGLEPVEFRRATAAEHDEATRKLEMRAKLNKGAY